VAARLGHAAVARTVRGGTGGNPSIRIASPGDPPANAAGGSGAAAPLRPRRRARLGIVIQGLSGPCGHAVLRELVALERRGIDFDIIALQPPHDAIAPGGAIWLAHERTHHAPPIGAAALRALLRAVRRHGPRVLAAVRDVAWHGRDRPLQAVRDLAMLPVAMHVAEFGERRGITHWHAHRTDASSALCWYLTRVCGTRFSIAVHGETTPPGRLLAARLDDAAFTVACSDRIRRRVQGAVSAGAAGRVHLNRHGPDLRILTRAAGMATRPPRPAGVPERWISVGRLTPCEGHDDLIALAGDLIAHGRELSLQIIGCGPARAALQHLIHQRELEHHVTLTGPLAFDRTVGRLLASDIFCLLPRAVPGQPHDAIPPAIVEAMALGLPVISRSVGAIPELVEDGVSGVLLDTDPDRFEEVVHELDRLLDDECALARMAAVARRRVDGLLLDRQAGTDELIGLFERCLSDEASGVTPGVPRGAVRPVWR